MNRRYDFWDCVRHCGVEGLPPGLERYYEQFDDQKQVDIIEVNYLKEIMDCYQVPGEKQTLMIEALKEIKADPILDYFTRFLIWDLCNARRRYEDNDYHTLKARSDLKYGKFYSFLILLSCAKPSMKMLRDRGVPSEYYDKLPTTPMEKQFEKWITRDDITVTDFPWDLNFYTCSIVWLDRFQFIPCRMESDITVYRNKSNHKVLALSHRNIEARRDGQINGTNGIYDEDKFVTSWEEDETLIRANPVNPMGFLEQEPVTLFKADWEIALTKGDLMLAFHIPAGPGYSAPNVRLAMEHALNYYRTYYSELNIKGFWSESWLYDSRLSLVLELDSSNILQVQRQFYLYPSKDGDDMLLERVFGKNPIDVLHIPCKTSLQERIVQYMKTGARFNALRMFVLRDEVSVIGECPYIQKEDVSRFKAVVDRHLDCNNNRLT